MLPSESRSAATGWRAGPGCVRGMVLAGLACVLSSPAWSQTLNLDAPAPPPPGAGKATMDLASRLNGQIAELQKQAQALTPERADQADMIALQVAVRTLARGLLRAGEQGGEPGSMQVIAGRTLALRIGGMDMFIRAHAGELPAEIRTQIEALCATAPEKLPEDDQTLARFLRDTLAPLVNLTPAQALAPPTAPTTPTTPTTPPTTNTPATSADPEASTEVVAFAPLLGFTGTLHEIAEQAKAPAVVITACDSLEARLSAADRWPAYARSARTIRLNAIDAMWAFTAAGATNLPAGARQALQQQFALAAEGICRPVDSGSLPGAADAAAVGSARLRCLALLCRCISLAAQAEPDSPGRALRDALGAVALARDPRTNQPRDFAADPQLADRLARLARLLETFRQVSGSGAIRAEDLPRQLRPAVRPLEESRRQAAGELLETLARAVGSPDIASDPAFLEAVASYRRRHSDLLLLRSVTERIARKPVLPTGAPGPQWILKDEFEPLGDRLLLLSRGLSSPKEHDEALTQWREFTQGILLLTRNGEARAIREALAAPESPLAQHLKIIAADRAGDLVKHLDEARADWLVEARKARQIPSAPLAAATRRLLGAHGAVALAFEWTRLRSGLADPVPGAPAADAGSALACWELSAQAAWLLAAPDATTTTSGLLLAADGKADEFLAAKWEMPGTRLRSLLRLVNSMAAGRGLHALSDDAADALRQLGMGPEDPDRGDSRGLRTELAVMSRYLEELGAAMGRGDSDAVASLSKYLDTKLAEAIAEVERSR